MWLSIMSFIGGPVISGLISAYNLHLQAATQETTIAADLAGKEIALQTVEAKAIYDLRTAEIGHPWEPEKLAFYVWLLYFAKCVIWDTMLGLGSTPALGGFVATWCNLIVTFYFAKRGFENVMRIFKR